MSNLPTLKRVVDDPAVRKSLEEVLGSKTPGFVSSIISAASSNRSLMECEPMSVVRAAAVAAALDLPINQNLGFAWLVPYKGVCTFQMGWKGYVQLAQRTGQYSRMNATPVLEGQIKSRNSFTGDFEFQEDATSDKIQGYLFFFRLAGGFEKFHYVTAQDMEAHARRYSQSYKKGGGVWAENFQAMALKTVTKHALSKWGPMSIEMGQAARFDGGHVLDVARGTVAYPDVAISPEDSAEKLAEIQAARDELIPGLMPPQTCEQFFEATKSNPPLLESMIAGLESAGHKWHADRLVELLKASRAEEKK